MSIEERTPLLAVARQPETDSYRSVIIPDVFPAASELKGLATGFHDVFKGSIPSQKEFEGADLDHRRGWLRIALANGETPAYLDLEQPLEVVKRQFSNQRPAINLSVILDKVVDIPRQRMALKGVFQSRDIIWDTTISGFGYNRRRVETARAYTGRIATSPNKHITGIHFPSARTHVWAHIWGEY